MKYLRRLWERFMDWLGGVLDGDEDDGPDWDEWYWDDENGPTPREEEE